jgi:hypothetical protein
LPALPQALELKDSLKLGRPADLVLDEMITLIFAVLESMRDMLMRTAITSQAEPGAWGCVGGGGQAGGWGTQAQDCPVHASCCGVCGQLAGNWWSGS